MCKGPATRCSMAPSRPATSRIPTATRWSSTTIPFNHGGPSWWPWLNMKLGLQIRALQQVQWRHLELRRRRPKRVSQRQAVRLHLVRVLMRAETSMSGRLRRGGTGVASAAAVLAPVAWPGSRQPPKAVGPPPAAAPPTAGPIDVSGTIHICSSCHGPDGRSVSSTFPRLAGQQKDYLVTQLQAFRDKTRADPHAQTYMWGMAAHLSDPTIDAIAAYYASQTPVAGELGASPEIAA